jgi:hypothetical protein
MKSAQSSRARSRASWRFALVASVVAACASTNDEFAAVRQSWRGATYDQVVMAWGTPSQSSVDSHTWLSDDSAPNVQGSGGVGGMIFAAARCDRTLAFRDGRVVDERWGGDPEYCKRFARRK